MIWDAMTKRGNEATTSDRWHVVHARWCDTTPAFARRVVSEHTNREAAIIAARALGAQLDPTRLERPIEQRDQVFVRPPRYRSLKYAARRIKRKRA